MSIRDGIIKHARRFLSMGRCVFFSAGNTLANEMLLAVHRSKSHPSQGRKCTRRRNSIGSVVFDCICVVILPAPVLSNVLFVRYLKS